MGMKKKEYIGYTALLIVVTGLFFALVSKVVPWIMVVLGYQVPQLLQPLTAYSLPIAMGVYLGIFTLLVAAALPITALMTIIGSTLFGKTAGFLLALISICVGGGLSYQAFKIGFLQAHPHLMRLPVGQWFAILQRHSRLCLLVGRLIPVIPFAAVTAIVSCSRLSVLEFTLYSCIGMVPQLVLYSALGPHAEHLYLAIASCGYLLGIIGICFIALLFIVSWMRTGTTTHNTPNIK
jgi:uncharacterized membrane protein YdjX (TVP38/TMEM64 family)